ncbi:MAG: DUF998 domain-containing protein [Nitrososphaeria archaeon]|nr:DUF998 domain-containing protein [Nitrososphaeria archaeon]
MRTASNIIAGTLIFLGSTQFILLTIVAEALYPGYSISENYISDLGVGPSALIFNSSIFVLGVTAVVSVHYLRQFILDRKSFHIALFLCGVGTMGVGIFPENFGIIHLISALTAFIFGALSAIFSFKIQKRPISYISLILGLFSIIALIFFVVFEYYIYFNFNYFGLGRGGMERMIVYPVLVWALGFGSYLIGQK